ncbi:hypothetical protein FACS189461_0610 [Spirochaetia bacterium]|nr:hypothetical protein FACS189461_0610 [Spirochaetia bacterium]
MSAKKLRLNAERLLNRIPWHKIGEKLEAKIPQPIKDGVKDFIGKIIKTGENLKGLAIAVTTGTAIAVKKGLLGLAKKDTPVGRISNRVSTALDKMHIMHQVGEKKLLPEKAITQIHNNETALIGYLVSKTKSNKKSIGDTLRETYGKARAVVDVIAASVVPAAKNAWQTVSKGFSSLASKAWGGIKFLFWGRG